MTLESANRKIQPKVMLVLIFLAIAVLFAHFTIKAIYDPRIPFLKTDANADWILYPFSAELVVREKNFINLTAEFTRNFELAAKPSRVYLHIKGFSEYLLWINDNKPPVAAKDKNNWKKEQVLEISQFLKEGTNTIRVKVTNGCGPPALWLYSEGLQNNLKTDTTWSASVMCSPTVSAGVANDCFLHPISSQGIRPFDALSKKLFMLILFFLISSAAFWICNYRQILTPKRILIVCIAVWTIVFINNVPRIPPTWGFDAVFHLDYVKYLLDHKAIPLANEGWETFQPPLFYTVSAIVMSLSRLFLTQSNALYSLKLIPFLCGIGQIFLAYFAALIVFPNSKTKQSLSAAAAALIPMNIYLSSYFSNESLSAFLMSLAILVTIIILNKSRSSSSLYLILGLIMGLAILTKFTILTILPVIFLVIIYKLISEEKCPAAKIGWNLGLMFMIIVVTAGWFFARNWIHFGKLFTGGVSVQPWWWQDPGFHTYKYFCQFGKVFSTPYFSGTYSLWDALYSTFWGDGFYAGTVSYLYRPPWNYEYMSVVYLLAIPAALAIIFGTIRATGNLIRTADKIWLLILGSLFTVAYSIIYMILQVPYYSQAKAFYGLGAILPISLIFAFGFDYIDNLLRNKKLFILRMFLYGWFGTLISAVFLSLFAGPSQIKAVPYLGLNNTTQQGKLNHIVTYYTQQLQTNPDDWDAHYELANSYTLLGKYDNAIGHYKKAVQLRHNWPDALHYLACALINKPNATPADKTQAVQYAELSCKLTGYLKVKFVTDLASAYAVAGQSVQAVTAAEKALKLAVSSGRQDMVEEIQKQLLIYKSQTK